MIKNYCKIPVYIGELPPPMGGVTVKNELLINSIFTELNAEVIDIYTYTRALWKLPDLFIKLIKIKLRGQRIYIGSGSLERYDMLLWLINLIGGEKFLSKVNTFVMGGMFVEFLKENSRCLENVRKTGNVFYELHKMELESKELGVNNSIYFPNCRDGKLKQPVHKLTEDKPIKLIHFSTVNREKGVPQLLEMVRKLAKQNVSFKLDIYGEIATDYKEEFMYQIDSVPNTKYCGVKRCSNKELYELLSSYDIFLLATRWKGESCVGVLVESKVAGIPAIVTDWRYNSEVIQNEKEGLVVSCKDDETISNEFAKAVLRLKNDSAFYNKLSIGASESVGRYDFNTYLPMMKNIIHEQIELNECK